MEEYDFGFVTPPENYKGIKLTVNEFRGQRYIHLREYLQDPDDGRWFPTKKGIAIRAEYVDIVADSYTKAGKLLTELYYRDVYGIIPEKQLNLFNEGKD